ncbi:MAG: RNA-binding protein [Nanoarchaeota archaeon]|nr:RNA-binding protein [Nanoarchaeota archaeon]
MSELLVEEKSIATPGEKLAVGMDYLPGANTYRDGDHIHSQVVGLVSLAGRAVKVMPFKGPYVPKSGDKIIGKVFDILMSGWRIETNTPYSAVLNVRDATTRFIRKDEDLSSIIDIDDFVVANITMVTGQNLIDLSMKGPGLMKVDGGRIIEINPMKVPRIIGKQGSMITLVKDATKCQITVGQNGFVWIKGTPEDELRAEQAILFIEEHAHEKGLTEKVEKLVK